VALLLQFRYLAGINYTRPGNLSGLVQLEPATHTGSQTVRHSVLYRGIMDARGYSGTLGGELFHQSFLGQIPGNLAPTGCRRYHLFRVAIRRSGTVANPPQLCFYVPSPPVCAVDGNKRFSSPHMDRIPNERHVIVLSGKLFWFLSVMAFLLVLLILRFMFWLAISSPGHRRPVAIMVSSQMIAHVGYAIDKLDNGSVRAG
jgi:hypothetical protein